MPRARISGSGFYVPPDVVTNHDLASRYGIETTHEWIVQRSGIEARRFAADGVGTADLAVPASKMAVAAAGLELTDIDLVVFCTLSPDHVFPGSGVFLQRKLGLCDGETATFAPCLDVRNQCAGFLYGLSVANAMVVAGSARNVLVVGAETQSHALDLSSRGRGVAVLFGDGAGAVVVSATDEDRGIRSVRLGADGRHAEDLCQRVWDISRRSFVARDADGVGRVPPEELYATMNGPLVFKHAVVRMTTALREACAEQGIGIEDVDLFLFHQANLRINQLVQSELGIPDHKTLHNIQRYGNTTAATLPLLIAEAERSGRLRPGTRVALAAFGSGFTWGASIIDW